MLRLLGVTIETLQMDRLAYNAEWFDIFGGTTVTHLARTCSYHASPLINCGSNIRDHTKYFKFLNIWVDHEDYLSMRDMVRK